MSFPQWHRCPDSRENPLPERTPNEANHREWFSSIGISRSQLISPKYNSDAILVGEWRIVPYP
jgi:hypothetical protein